MLKVDSCLWAQASLLEVFQGPYVMPELELGWALCKANAFPSGLGSRGDCFLRSWFMDKVLELSEAFSLGLIPSPLTTGFKSKLLSLSLVYYSNLPLKGGNRLLLLIKGLCDTGKMS